MGIKPTEDLTITRGLLLALLPSKGPTIDVTDHYQWCAFLWLSFRCSVCERMEFFDSVADRIWQAWWKADGHPLEYISGRLRENLSAAAIPFALVAHDGAGAEAGNINRSPP